MAAKVSVDNLKSLFVEVLLMNRLKSKLSKESFKDYIAKTGFTNGDLIFGIYVQAKKEESKLWRECVKQHRAEKLEAAKKILLEKEKASL